MKLRLTNPMLAAVVAVLLLAAATRILGANSAPLWTDEGASVYISESPVARLIHNHHPPLYFFALGAWRVVAGDSRLALRFLAILGGVLTTAVVYRIGKDWFSHAAAISAAILFAVSDLAIEYGHQVRHYSWLVLGVALMALFLLRYLRRPSIRALVPYVLSLTFAFYSHYLAFLMFPLHVLAGLFVWRGSRRDKGRLVGAWIVTVILYLPWYVAFQHLVQLVDESGIASRPGLLSRTLDSMAQMAAMLSNYEPALVLGLTAIAVWALLQRPNRSAQWTSRAFLIASGAGLFAVMFVMHTWLKILAPRTLVFLTPFLFIIAGYGFSLLQPRFRNVLLAGTILFAVMYTPIIQPRYDSDKAAAALAEHYQPGDLVIMETGFDDNAFAYEVQRALDDPNLELIKTIFWASDRFEITPVVPQVQPALDRHNRVWIVHWLHAAQVLPYLQTPESGFQQTFEQDIPIGEQYEDLFPDPVIQIWLFERVQQ